MRRSKEECFTALKRIQTINLDYVLEKLGYEGAEEVSCSGIHDYPTLEMSGDIEVLKDVTEEFYEMVDSIDSLINVLTKEKDNEFVEDIEIGGEEFYDPEID